MSVCVRTFRKKIQRDPKFLLKVNTGNKTQVSSSEEFTDITKIEEQPTTALAEFKTQTSTNTSNNSMIT